MPRVHHVSQLCCSGLSTAGRNQALLSQQTENLPQLAESFLSQTHLQCLSCALQSLICPTKGSWWYKTQVLQNKYRINTPQKTFYYLRLVQALTISVCIVSSTDFPLWFQSQSKAVPGTAAHGQSRDQSLTGPVGKENLDFLIAVFSSWSPSLHSLTSGSLPLSKDHS